MDPPLKPPPFKLKVGEMSDVVESPSGITSLSGQSKAQKGSHLVR